MDRNKFIKYIYFNDFVRQRRENQPSSAVEWSTPEVEYQELPQELPEVEVKSDLSKWLLLGGCVVLSYYLWRKIK